MAVIYKATSRTSGKSYIGKTQKGLTIRKAEHIREAFSGCSKKYFHKALAKYGVNDFSWEVLEECSDSEAFEREILQIAEHKTFGEGYNLTKGGEGSTGRICTDEMKAKISKANKGRSTPWDPATKEARCKAMRGIKRSSQFCLDISKRSKGNTNMLGKTHSEETRKKISKTRLEKYGIFTKEQELAIARLINTGAYSKACLARAYKCSSWSIDRIQKDYITNKEDK